jgi:hypothetical protein
MSSTAQNKNSGNKGRKAKSGSSLPSFKKAPLRQPSPSVQGLMFHGPGAKSGSHALFFMGCKTLPEVIDLVPSVYRVALATKLTAAHRLAEKLASATRQHRALQAHLNAGTYPSNIASIRTPVVQCGEEFKATQPDQIAEMAALVATLKTGLLKSEISLKAGEVAHYREATSLESLVTGGVTAANLIKIDRPVRLIPQYLPDEVSGIKTFDKFVPDTDEDDEIYELVLNQMPHAFERAISLVMEREATRDAKVAEKAKMREDADIEMADATVQTQTIQQTVRAEVQRAVNAVASSSSNQGAFWLFRNSVRSNQNTHSRSPQEEENQEQPLRQTSGSRLKRQREDEGSPQRCPGSPSTAREGKRQGYWQEVNRYVRHTSWTWEKPQSYPDALLTMPHHMQTQVVLSRVPVAVLDAARFRKGVHVHRDCIVPMSIQIHVSAGLKFMFSSAFDASLPLKSYNDFCERLRWKYRFFKEENRQQYDPDYDLGRRSHMIAPSMPVVLEMGLRAGKREIERQLSRLKPDVEALNIPGMLDVNKVERFIKENKYMILQTDKNLGTAIVTRTWAIQETFKLLNDHKSYQSITLAEARAQLSLLKADILHIATAFTDHNPQLERFLLSNTLEDNIADSIPKFYGIPKIHKSPWRMRPICPGFAALANPVSLFVKKELDPVLEECPFVIKGSKQFAFMLSQFKIPPHKRCWIVVGDVVAYYPNIPIDNLRRIIRERFRVQINKEWPNEPELNATRCDIMYACLQVATEPAIVKYQDLYFQQIGGLPMGYAASPCFANIYGDEYERPIVENEPRILFYGRFIDDLFAIIDAPTALEALNIANTIRIDGVDILWDQCGESVDFLDLHLWLDVHNCRVQHKPFYKKWSHFERIPWASNHPNDVKRGTFIGEMSRLASLSSTPEIYQDSLQGLATLYIERGYPARLVKSWVEKNSQVRWSFRLSQLEPAGNVLVLKSRFNPVWDTFNVNRLYETIIAEWAAPTGLPLTSLGRRQVTDMLGQRKRPRTERVHSILRPAEESVDEDGAAASLDGSVLRQASGLVDEADHTFRAVVPDYDLGEPRLVSQERFSQSQGDLTDFIRHCSDSRWLVSKRRNKTFWDFTRLWNKALLEEHARLDPLAGLLAEDLDDFDFSDS